MEDLANTLRDRLQEAGCSTEAAEYYSEGIQILALRNSSYKLILYSNAVQDRVDIGSATKMIHLDEDIIRSQLNKITARILAISGKAQKIYARETVVARIDKKVCLDFQKEHHIQVPLPGKYRYGLFYEGELISVAVFSGGRKMRDKPSDYRSFELLRFCHKKTMITIGGISKLIKAFRQDFHPGDVMTYVDRDWAQESSLKQIGFEERGITDPQLFWVKGDQRRLADVYGLMPGGFFLKRNNGSIKMVLPITDTD